MYTVTRRIVIAFFTLKVPVLGNTASHCPTEGHRNELDFAQSEMGTLNKGGTLSDTKIQRHQDTWSGVCRKHRGLRTPPLVLVDCI